MTPRYARLLVKLYLCLCLYMLAFRVLCLTLVHHRIGSVGLLDYAQAFWLGWRFDNVIICVLLALPFLIFTANHFLFQNERAQKLGLLPLYLTLPLVLTLQIIDMFYFDHFGVRITAVLMNWFDDIGFATKMVLNDPVWILGVVIFPLILWPIFARVAEWGRLSPPTRLLGKNQTVWALCSVLTLAMLFVGIRGRVAIKSPLREGVAYFSPNPALNQLALNPLYTFFSSVVRSRKYRKKVLSFMSQDEAIQVFRGSQGLPPTTGQNPFERPALTGPLKHWNVVVVMMEGMSAHYTHYRKSPSWAPVLDRLMAEGIEFTQAFSAGTHTYNGIWSTLFSFPSPYSAHPLKRDVVPQLDSLPEQWRALGRTTTFFTTHDEHFDNMAGFLRQNGFEHIVAQDDYPQERVFSILGVPDHDMYDRAVEVLGKDGKPFFAALLTGSNHKPHVIPPELKSQFNGPDEEENIVRYADWALGHFVEKAQAKPWFKDTLFVILADHGHAVGNSPVDQILSYHHMPLIFWAPGLVTHREVHSPALQIDILPTVAGLLGGPVHNNTLGRDVLSLPRDWAYMVNDGGACVRFIDKLECEAEDKRITDYALDVQEWKPVHPKEAWHEVHAELQLADWVLKTQTLRP